MSGWEIVGRAAASVGVVLAGLFLVWVADENAWTGKHPLVLLIGALIGLNLLIIWGAWP